MSYEDGTLLWYWYDRWIVVAALAIAGILTLLLVARRSWSGGALVAKVVAAVALVPPAVLALDRLGMQMSIGNDQTLGYAGIVGAVIAASIGGVDALLQRRNGKAANVEFDESFDGESEEQRSATGAMGTDVTPTLITDGSSDATQTAIASGLASDPDSEADETLVAPEAGGDDATVMMGGAAATQMASAPAASVATLRVTKGAGMGEALALESGETTIGRAADNTIVIDDLPSRLSRVQFPSPAPLTHAVSIRGGTDPSAGVRGLVELVFASYDPARNRKAQ